MQGEGRPFFKRGPFPCQKNSLTLFQQTHDAPEEGAAGVGRPPVIFLAGFGQQFFQFRASRGFGIGPGEGRQKILHVRLGSGEQLFAPLFGQVQTGGIGLLAVLAGLDGFGQRPGVHLAHEAAYELQLAALAFTVADAGIQAQGLQQIGRQGQSVQFVDGQLGQLGAQILQGRTLTLFGRAAELFGGFLPVGLHIPLILFLARHLRAPLPG